MSAISRRGGTKQIKMRERSADPTQVADEIQVYAKEDSGVTQLFARSSDGTVHQLTPPASGGGATAGREVPPEIWFQQDVAASQSNVDLSAQNSQLFDTWKVLRAGSIVGLASRLTEAITDATADSLLVTVTINGTPGTLQISHNSAGNASGGEATQATGIDTFVAGDLIGIEITTLGTFAPVTTDLEAYIEIDVD